MQHQKRCLRQPEIPAIIWLVLETFLDLPSGVRISFEKFPFGSNLKPLAAPQCRLEICSYDPGSFLQIGI